MDVEYENFDFEKAFKVIEPIEEIKIDHKVYELRFGIGFVRIMDKLFPLRVQGTSTPYGSGLMLMLSHLQQGSPTALCDVILAATSTLTNKPDQQMVERYLESEEVDLEELCQVFTRALLGSKVTQRQVLSQLKTLDEKEQQEMLELLGLDKLKTAEKPTKNS